MNELEQTKAVALSLTGEAHELANSLVEGVVRLYSLILASKNEEEANYRLSQAQGLRDGLAALLGER